MLTLAQPYWLLALPLPWLAWWLKKFLRPPKMASNQVLPSLLHPHSDLLLELAQATRPWQQWPWLWLLGCSMLILALARPEWPAAQSTPSQRDYLLAIDISGSMRTRDSALNGQPVSRLAMLKQVVGDFLQQRQGDQVGVIAFADEAFTLAPITADLALVNKLIAEIDQGVAGEKTALGTAIALGVQRLIAHRPRGQTLLVMTDGANTAGAVSPLAAMQIAKDNGVRINTIGIGGSGPALFPRGPVAGDELAAMPLDTALLQRIAAETGGKYYAAADARALQRIIADVERIAPVPRDNARIPASIDISWLPLIIGLLLILGEEGRRRWRVFPA